LGLGDTANRSTPTNVPGLVGTRWLSLGYDQTFAVTRTGTVLAAGANARGQLGDGTIINRSAFVASDFSCGCQNFVKVIGGGYFSAGIKADGTTWVWGWNNHGQLGLGLPMLAGTQVTSPQQLTLPAGRIVRNLYLGSYHAFAVADDGTVWSWGQNGNGELGLGDTTDRNVPVQVPALTGARDLALGYANTYVLMADGTVRAMGDNQFGQVGDGTTVTRTSPVTIAAVVGARQIVAGRYGAFASMPNGSVLAVGRNAEGALGQGDLVDRSSFVAVPALAGARDLAMGSAHSAAIISNGSLLAAGRSTDGELGLGDWAATRSTFATVTSVGAVRSVSSGRSHVMVVTGSGTVLATGYNYLGQLGLGDTTDRNTYTAVTALGDIRDLTLGGYNSIVIDTDGVFRAWGDNSHGQMGVGDTTGTTTPQFAAGGCTPPTVPSSGGQYLADGATVIAAGSYAGTTVVLSITAGDIDGGGTTLTPWVEVTTGSFAGTCGNPGANMFSGAAVAAPTGGAGQTLTVTVTGLTPGASYRWRGCTVDQTALASPWLTEGGTPDFIIKTSFPFVPTLVSPADNGSTQVTTPSLVATYLDAAPITAGRIEFRIGTSATCGTSVTQTGSSAANTASGANGSWTTASLPVNTYFWCARSVNGAGNASGWSATRRLVIGAASLTISTSTPSVNLGTILPNTDVVASFSADVQTDALNGYQLVATDASDTSAMSCVCGGALPDWTGTNATPTQWPALTTSFGGLTVRNATGGRLAKWGTGTGTAETDFSAVNKYVGLRSTNTLLHERTSYSAATDTVLMTYRIDVGTAQQGGAYSTTVNLTALASP
ncbi:MAG: chromosome condensation regulator, partial [Thermoleophilia bacterium]|nr:chromosome condensation regulator [Thermoleophilia bacterium]